MVESLTYIYTTKAEMESIFGEDGILLRADDNSTDALETTETNQLTDVREEATDEINFYCLDRYTAANLDNNIWVRRACSTIACHLLSQRRGNPEQYLAPYERLVSRLEKVQQNKLNIPRIAPRDDETPGHSNVVVDDVYTKRKLRVQFETSQGDTDSLQDSDRPYLLEP